MTTSLSRSLETRHRPALQAPGVVELMNRYISEGAVVVDPYSGGDYERTTHSNSPEEDSVPSSGWRMPSDEYLDMLFLDHGGLWADAVIFNPRHWGQAGRLAPKAALHRLLKPGGIAVTLGWSSVGFREVDWRYEMLAVRLVCWGRGSDLIVTVERKGK